MTLFHFLYLYCMPFTRQSLWSVSTMLLMFFNHGFCSLYHGFGHQQFLYNRKSSSSSSFLFFLAGRINFDIGIDHMDSVTYSTLHALRTLLQWLPWPWQHYFKLPNPQKVLQGGSRTTDGWMDGATQYIFTYCGCISGGGWDTLRWDQFAAVLDKFYLGVNGTYYDYTWVCKHRIVLEV